MKIPLLALGFALAAVAADAHAKPDTIRLAPRVLVLNLDPVVPGSGGQRLHQVCRWNDPRLLAKQYAEDVRRASHGLVNYSIVKWIDADEFPVKADGFRYTPAGYLDCHAGRAKWHQPDAVDYPALVARHRLTDWIDRDAADEVWVFGAPYFGFFESCMAGPGAFWINGTPLPEVKCRRAFAIMGFSYERGVGEMLEDLGHRAESTLAKVHGAWEAGQERNAWERFTLYDAVAPGRAACGNVHWAPNSKGDYDWGNRRPVPSTCDDWLSYPEKGKGKPRLVDCAEWGGGDMRAHHVWWFAHFPHAEGLTEGKLNNWWRYVFDFNRTVIAGGAAGPR